MSASNKKFGPATYVNALAGILGAAGLVSTILCSTKSNAHALPTLTTLVAGAVVAIALILVALWAPTKKGNHDPICAVAVLAAIAIFSAIIGNIISERVILISGLFSYNSGNMIGWSVFYVSVAAMVCYVAAILLLIIGSFLKSVKE